MNIKNKKIKKSFKTFELEIPKKYYPKSKNNYSKLYSKKISQILTKLHDIELDLDISLINICGCKKIIETRKKTNRPISRYFLVDLDRKINKSNDDYENYCLRIYIYRETICQFISSFLDIKNDNFFNFLKDSKIRDLKIDKVLLSFDKKELKSVIEFRNKITHKLILDTGDVDKKILTDIIKELKININLVKKTLTGISKINEKIVLILNDYKNK